MTQANSIEMMGFFEHLPEGHDQSTRQMLDQFKRLQEQQLARGETLPEPQLPDLTLEKTELQDESESIWAKFGHSIESAFNFLVVKPVEYVWNLIKDHPIRTIMIALAAFAMWYYSAPLAAGISGIKEQGMKLVKGLFGKAVAIDPEQIDVFDDLLGPATGDSPQI